MKKKAKVHMLATDDYHGKLIWHYPNLTKDLRYSVHKESNKEIANYLYITTDEEIKEEDWYLYNGKPYKCLHSMMGTENPKIISSTDPKPIADGVKKVQQSFIEEYCKAGGIDKVMVKMECLTSTHTAITDFSKDPVETKALSKPKCVEYALKTDSNNCIIVYPVKDKMYSKEELLGLTMGNSTIIDWINENL